MGELRGVQSFYLWRQVKIIIHEIIYGMLKTKWRYQSLLEFFPTLSLEYNSKDIRVGRIYFYSPSDLSYWDSTVYLFHQMWLIKLNWELRCITAFSIIDYILNSTFFKYFMKISYFIIYYYISHVKDKLCLRITK